MHSAELLDIINSKTPYELLAVLRNASFTLTDTTEEGDSVLHLLTCANFTNFKNLVCVSVL